MYTPDIVYLKPCPSEGYKYLFFKAIVSKKNLKNIPPNRGFYLLLLL